MTTKKSTGLEKQDAYLTSLHSRPLFCPHCHGMHSYIEARGGNDWSKVEEDIKCPVTGNPLIHCIPLIGENFFSVPVEPTVYVMSDAEADAWDALNDQSDWMNDDEYNAAATKIVEQYRPHLIKKQP